MARETKKKIGAAIRYTLLIVTDFVMVYPLVWMVGVTFRTNSEIFTSAWFWPRNPVFDGCNNAFKSYGSKINLLTPMLNTYRIVVPKMVFMVISATITAYGFARFEFKGEAILFSLMIFTLFLSQVVLNTPQYITFNKWGWTNSYLPLVVPFLFVAGTYFVFMSVQFLRGAPKELEEAAKIDGYNFAKTPQYIITPILKLSLVSYALFQLMWTSNNFMGPLIYISDMPKYASSIYLRTSMDGDIGFQWDRILAMSLISIIPSLIAFFYAQNSFIDGIVAGGMKG